MNFRQKVNKLNCTIWCILQGLIKDLARVSISSNKIIIVFNLIKKNVQEQKNTQYKLRTKRGGGE